MLPFSLLFAALATAGDPSPPAEAPAPADADPVTDALAVDPIADAPEAARLVWTGALGGIGAGTVDLALHRRLPPSGEASLVGIQAVHGWMASGPWRLVGDDRRIATTLALLDGEGPTCGEPEPATALVADTEELVFAGPAPAWTTGWPVQARPVQGRRCSRDGATGWLVGPADADPAWSLDVWETRLALRWRLADGTVVDAVGRPIEEGTRRFSVLARAAEQGAVLLDAGDFLDGASSVKDGALSLHRPTGLAALRRLGHAALVPGRSELAAGARAFLAEAGDLPYLATNWVAAEGAPALPDHRIVTIGELRVGVVGVVDPRIAAGLPALAAEGVTLADPVDRVQPVVDALRAGESPVDLVVLLTTASPPTLARIADLTGVDLVLGERSAADTRVQRQELALGRRGSPPVLPLAGIQSATLEVDADGVLDRISVARERATLQVTPDPIALAAVTAVRAQHYPPLDRPLLPAGADPTAPIADGTFARVVCEAILDETHGDVALLPALPPGKGLPGALTALLVADRLAVRDVVEVHHVPGDRLRKLLDQVYGTIPVHCGAPLGEKFPKARGRPLEDDRLYRLITTDRLRQTTGLDGLLGAARSPRRFDQPGYRAWTGRGDAPRSLRGTALDALDRLRAEHGDALLTFLQARSPSDKDPQLLVRVRQLSLRAEGFQGVEDDAYADVPETLATSPSSLTLGTAADVALDYSDRRVLWDLRGRSAFTRLRTADDVQETADDVKLSTSVTLPGASTPEVFGVTFRPYAEGLLDAEWTPVEADDGSTNPRQADLSLTVGLASSRAGVLRTLRVGLLGSQDLSSPEKNPEVGGRLEAETWVTFGPGLRWVNQLDAFAWADTVDQDASDLRFKARLDSRVALPLARWLDISVYGGAFAFQGRVPETRGVRASFTLGASLDLGGVFVL